MISRIDAYLRLSRDDGNADESDSITNQRSIILNYIASDAELKNIPVTEHVDDGYSGVNFARPAAARLIEAIRKGGVSCVIVKDFSRLGRAYLEVSRLIEVTLPRYGVRFISVNDRYDSAGHAGTAAEPDVVFRNLINALYSREASKKIKAAKRVKIGQGLNINAFAPYGYSKSRGNKYCLVIDKPAAKIVWRVFNMYLNGQKPGQIAKTLNAEGVLTPSAHMRQNGVNLPREAAPLWTGGIIGKLLGNEQYTGVLLCNRVESRELGGKEKVYRKREEWTRVLNAHPAIISMEMWNAVNSLKSRHGVRTYKKPASSRVLYKKVRCGHCGRYMRYRSEPKKNGLGKYRYYCCAMSGVTGEYGCHNKMYNAREIENAVNCAVMAQIKLFVDIRKTRRAGEKDGGENAPSVRTNAARLNREITLLEASKRALYERYRLGGMNIDGYKKERETIDADIAAKEVERGGLFLENKRINGLSNNADNFFLSLWEGGEAVDLPSGLVNTLVESVYVYGKNRLEIKFSFADEWERNNLYH